MCIRDSHNTSAAFRYHPILSRYPRHNTNASPLTIKELATVDRKYPKYIFLLLTGETLKSFLVPFALSCTIVRFTQNVTVIQLTAISDAVSCCLLYTSLYGFLWSDEWNRNLISILVCCCHSTLDNVCCPLC